MQNQHSGARHFEQQSLSKCPYCKGLSPTCVRCDDGGYSEESSYRPLRFQQPVSQYLLSLDAIQKKRVLLRDLYNEVFDLKGTLGDRKSLHRSTKLIKSFEKLEISLKKDTDLNFWLQKLMMLVSQHQFLFSKRKSHR